MFRSREHIRQKYLQKYLINGESSKEGWRRLTPKQTPIITILNVSLPSRRTRARWTQNKQRTMRKARVLHNISILEDAADFFEWSFARSSCCFGFASTSERCKMGPVFSVKLTAILFYMACLPVFSRPKKPDSLFVWRFEFLEWDSPYFFTLKRRIAKYIYWTKLNCLTCGCLISIYFIWGTGDGENKTRQKSLKYHFWGKRTVHHR